MDLIAFTVKRAVISLLLLSALGAHAADQWRQVGSSGLFRFIETSSGDPDTFRVAAAKTCGTTPICMVGFWSPGKAPRSMPMTDAQVAARKAQYSRNLNTGRNEWVWSCKVNPSECAR